MVERLPSPQRAPLLSVVVPVRNEAASLLVILERIAKEPLDKEIVVVDDGSTDGSRSIAEQFAASRPYVRVLAHAQGEGKGRALRTGFAACQGEYVIVQDADLEYHPAEYRNLLRVVQAGEAEAAYGSRLKLWEKMSPLQRLGNQALTWTCNLLYGTRLTDIMTCYKLVPRTLLGRLTLESRRFDIECELTAKILLRGWRIAEVPIAYSPRTYAEGKKIRWKDGFHGLWTLLKYRFRSSGSRARGAASGL